MNNSLSKDEISEALTELNDWKHVENTITKSFTFGTFKEALAFIIRVGFEAESQNHHPSIQNVYNSVTLSLSTHDAGDTVTNKDVELAKAIDSI